MIAEHREQFLALAKKYTDFSELTTPMINEFVDKILVHAPEKVDGDRVQEVEIYLNFIGYFAAPVPELTPEEEKRQEYLRKHRMQSRERYKALKDGTRKVGEPFQIVCKCCGKTFESKMSNAICGTFFKGRYLFFKLCNLRAQFFCSASYSASRLSKRSSEIRPTAKDS